MEHDNTTLITSQHVSTPHDASHPTTQRDMTHEEIQDENVHENFTLGIENVVLRFRSAHVPRSKRTIERYCLNGELSCVKVKTLLNTDRWLVNAPSVDDRIEQIKQTLATENAVTHHDAPQHVTGDDVTRHDEPRRAEPEPEKPIEDTAELERLRNELRDLQEKYEQVSIQNQAHSVIEREYTNQIARLQRQITKFNRVIGEVSTLLRLRAPEEDHERITTLIENAEKTDG